MEEDKVIERRVAVLNPAKINVGVTVFVSIKTDRHNAEWLKRFSEVIAKYAGGRWILPDERTGGLFAESRGAGYCGL